MQDINSKEVISHFLFSILPDRTRTRFELLAGLDFPLNDYDTLAKQIQKQREEWDSRQCDLADDILTHLSPLDFPILNVQSVLEKYHVRLPFPDLSRFFPQLEPFPEPVYQPEVPVWQEYLAMFGPICVREAYEAYRASLDSGVPEPVAYYDGIRAGRSCQSAP